MMQEGAEKNAKRETADFWAFSKAGRALAEWHLHYETVEPWPLAEHTGALALDPAKDFLVGKMTFAREDKETAVKRSRERFAGSRHSEIGRLHVLPRRAD